MKKHLKESINKIIVRESMGAWVVSKVNLEANHSSALFEFKTRKVANEMATRVGLFLDLRTELDF